MINRMTFNNSQPMNLVHRTKEGSQIWLGDYYAATNIPLLKQKNIRSVLTSAAMLGVNYPKEHSINHKVINAFDIPSYKMTPHFDEVFRFISDSLKNGNILVHCAAGISRSTTFVLVYLMRGEGMSFRQAIDYVRAKRPIICPNFGFQNQLKRFEITLSKNQPQKNKSEKQQKVNEKKVVLDFLNEEKKRPLKQEMNLTMSSKINQINPSKYNSKQSYAGFLRGKSMNYGKKNMTSSSTVEDRKNQFLSIGKVAQQLQSFKLQNPKIVTIRK